MNDNTLKIALITSIFFSLAALLLRYIRERDSFFEDASSYFVILMILYINIPAYVHLNTGETLVGASLNTIRAYSGYSLYYTSVIILYYFLTTLVPKCKYCQLYSNCRQFTTIAPIKSNVIYLLYAIICFYLLFIVCLKLPPISVLWTNRALASIIKAQLSSVYKIQFLFMTVVSFVIYLVLKHNSPLFLFMLSPFILLDLMLTDRGFLFQSLLIGIYAISISGRSIPTIRISLISLFIISFAVIRTVWNRAFLWSEFFNVPGELLLTTEAAYLIYESTQSINPIQSIVFSISKIFTPTLMNLLVGGIPHIGTILAVETPLSFGFGGSLLAEVFGYKNSFMFIIYPFITIGYLLFINYLKNKAGFFGILTYGFYLASTLTIFRSGIIFASMEPMYYTLYSALWYWCISIAFKNKVFIQPYSSTKKTNIKVS